MKKIEIKKGAWGDILPSSVQISSKIKIESSSWGETEKTVTQETKVDFEPSQWNELGGLQEPQMVRQFDGVNELNSFAIKDGHATRNKNVTTDNYPALSVRKGVTALTNAFTDWISGIGVRGNELHVISEGVWKKYDTTNATWSTVRTGLTNDKHWTFINFQGSFSVNHLIAVGGTGAWKYDGTSVTALANAPASSDFIATHDNRVYIASDSTVHFSGLRKAEDWNTVNDSGQFVVETSDGKPITGLVAGSSRLTVFKKNSIHELFGNHPGNFQMKIVTDNLGTPTGKTCQVIDGVIYFLGNDGVYRYSGGSLPTSDFSMAIRSTINSINKDSSYTSVAWTVGRKYYLAIPTLTAGHPNTILEYDIEFNMWNMWEFPERIVSGGAVWNDTAFIGTALGNVYKLGNTNVTDNGTAVSWEWVSKPFTLSSLATKSRWYRMWVIADIPVGATLDVHVSTKEDGENWTLVQNIPSNVDAQAKEIRIPTTLINESNWVRIRLSGIGQVVVYEVSRQERLFPFGHS